MAIISTFNLGKSYADRILFADVVFSLEDRERAALIGPNGCGKSTLLKILAGQVEPDAGAVHRRQGLTLGHLPQDVDSQSETLLLHSVVGLTTQLLELVQRIYHIEHSASDSEQTAVEYAELAHRFEDVGGFELQAKALSILSSLGFQGRDLYKPIQHLSGGQKVRAALAGLLLKSPDLLLLDEPTNHLDIQACEWLQDYIINRYSGTAFVVSHDRYFLDKVVSRVVEMDKGKIFNWQGAYTDYARSKEIRVEEERKLYKLQQKEIARIEQAIQTLFSHRKFASRDSKVKQLERIKRISLNVPERSISAGFKSADRSGAQVLKLEGLSKSYGEKRLFCSVDYTLSRGCKVGIVGPNGSGKTTLLKIVAGLEEPDTGFVELGYKVSFVYFAQEFTDLSPDNSVLDELLCDADITAREARDLLAQFLFIGDDAFKPVGVLSGGEKCRLALAKAIAQAPNLLVLDEPTNHLDIASREILENALREFDGSILTASHDRYLLDQITDQIIEIAGGEFTTYLGRYSDYRTKKSQLEPAQPSASSSNRLQKTSQAPKRPLSKLRELEKRARETSRSIEKLETDIHFCEARQAELTAALADEDTYRDGRAKECTEEYNKLQSHLSELYTRWENLSEILSQTESDLQKGS